MGSITFPGEQSLKITKQINSLSTGCTLLNLALTNDPYGGFLPGRYYYLVGDSTSGKTFFSMTCFAEAARHPAFKHYRRIYDNVEDGMLMNTKKLFGAEVSNLIEAPGVDENGFEVHSSTIEEFYYHLDDAFKDGRPFIYVLDSMDGLDAKDDQEKFEEQKKAHRKGNKVSGSYGMAKAKKNSTTIRRAMIGLRETKSILIIISQTRDNTNAMAFGSKKTRSGGKALRFYATAEIWTSLGGAIKKQVRGKSRKIGTKILLEVKKNRTTGDLHKIQTAIYPSYGIDDTGSMIDYLLDEGWWKKGGQSIRSKELQVALTKGKLVTWIEEKGSRVKKLKEVTGKCWNEIKKACALDRRGRYD